MAKAITADYKPLAGELLRKALSVHEPLNGNRASSKPGASPNADDTRQISAIATGQINAAMSGKGINIDTFA